MIRRGIEWKASELSEGNPSCNSAHLGLMRELCDLESVVRRQATNQSHQSKLAGATYSQISELWI